MTNRGERERNISLKFSLQGIQALRGLAALMVVIHHALEESNGSAGKFSPDFLTTAGAAGVDVFFVISGFIMFYTSFCRGGDIPSSREFLLRRALRIYPLYWLCCFAMLGLAAVGFPMPLGGSPLQRRQARQRGPGKWPGASNEGSHFRIPWGR